MQKHEEDKEKKRAYMRAYKLAHKEKLKEQSRASAARMRAKDPERFKLIKKKFRLRNREKLNEESKAYYQKNIEKRRAAHRAYSKKSKEKLRTRTIGQNIAWAAIASKKISKEPCAICGERIVEGHHNDYSKPLEITWLCRKHHAAWHRVFIPND